MLTRTVPLSLWQILLVNETRFWINKNISDNDVESTEGDGAYNLPKYYSCR